MHKKDDRVFSALLRYWRSCRGISQIDLALAAGVSSRHLSFLETGRARPSREMVLRLGATLSVPLREQNTMLHAAGFDEAYPEPSIESGLSRAVAQVIDVMLERHEPFPMIIFDRHYDLMRFNQGAARLLGRFLADPSALRERPNLFSMLFDPRLGRPFTQDWDKLARQLVARLHREALARPEDAGLAELLESLFQYPDVPREWRHPDFSVISDPTFTLKLKRGDLQLAFLSTLTVFDAPQNVTLEEICMESFFPLDEATAATCRDLAKLG